MSDDSIEMPNDDIMKVRVAMSNFYDRNTITVGEVLAIAAATISEDYYKHGFSKGCERSRHIQELNK